MNTTTRIARISAILLPDGTHLRFDGAQAVVEEVVEDDGEIEGDAAHLAHLLRPAVSSETSATAVTEPSAPVAPPARLARGSVAPATGPERSSRRVVAADVRRGGFQADISDPRLAGKRVLVRKWKGVVVRVTVSRAQGGFIFDGKLWPSLSSIARRVCTVVDDAMNHLDSWCNVEPQAIRDLIAELHSLLDACEREVNGKA